ncbi:MAG: hypothetical protein NTW09_04235, partial [Candidatus Omnitrophica bacterium]|nr:hypothetical protein [Candidatus Omnitrophota bacterium]
MKILEKEKAIELRKTGLTYNEIEKCLNISKSSLSSWLRDVPYVPTKDTRERRRLASYNSGQVLHRRKLERVNQIMQSAKQEVKDLKVEDLKLLGTMAYWTEGSKTKDSLVQITNTDPIFIRFVLKWLREICEVKEEKLRVHLRIHPDTNKKDAENYWSKITGIPLAKFHKTTAKISGSGGRKYKKLGHGVATITICDTDLYYRITGWIKGLQEKSVPVAQLDRASA